MCSQRLFPLNLCISLGLPKQQWCHIAPVPAYRILHLRHRHLIIVCQLLSHYFPPSQSHQSSRNPLQPPLLQGTRKVNGSLWLAWNYLTRNNLETVRHLRKVKCKSSCHWMPLIGTCSTTIAPHLQPQLVMRTASTALFRPRLCVGTELSPNFSEDITTTFLQVATATTPPPLIKLKSTVFQGPDEEWHTKNMHNTYLPEKDPLFQYIAIKNSLCPSAVTRVNQERPTLGLDIRVTSTVTQGKSQAKVINVKAQSRAKVLVGDVIVKVNGTTIASEDGTLLPDKSLHDVVHAIKNSLTDQILTMDVLWSYQLGYRVHTGTSAGSVVASVALTSTNRLSTYGQGAGLKSTGLDDNDNNENDN